MDEVYLTVHNSGMESTKRVKQLESGRFRLETVLAKKADRKQRPRVQHCACDDGGKSRVELAKS